MFSKNLRLRGTLMTVTPFQMILPPNMLVPNCNRGTGCCINVWLWWWMGWHVKEAGLSIPCLSSLEPSMPASQPLVAPFLSPAHSISFLLLVSVWRIKKEELITSYCCLISSTFDVTAMDICLYLNFIYVVLHSRTVIIIHLCFLKCFTWNSEQ